MIVLGIDTAGSSSGVALMAGEEVIAVSRMRHVPHASRPLLRTIDRLLAATGYALIDLGGIAVNVGPGAFTGLRVGLATAQGLALASGKPLVGCTAFEALVALVSEWEGAICPVLEARKGEVYAALYDQRDCLVRQVMPGMVLTPERLCALITEPTLFLGTALEAHRAVFAARLGAYAVCVNCGMDDVGGAVGVARVGQRRFAGGGGEEPSPLVPLYIRPADARLPRQITQERSGLQDAASAPSSGEAYVISPGKGCAMLEGMDEALIERVKQENSEFCRLLEEHEQYEVELALYNDVRFLTSDQEVERKRLQKLKLQGKDRMIAILHQYQAGG